MFPYNQRGLPYKQIVTRTFIFQCLNVALSYVSAVENYDSDTWVWVPNFFGFSYLFKENCQLHSTIWRYNAFLKSEYICTQVQILRTERKTSESTLRLSEYLSTEIWTQH